MFQPKWNLQAEGNKEIFLKNTLPVYLKVSSLKDIQKSYGLLRDWYRYFFFRKDFRPSYGKLATIGSILPQVPLLGLAATATKKTRPDIIESLGMVNAVEILENPDWPNIYFSSSSRPDREEDKILVPSVESLKKERTKFPFPVVFGTLETISSCYAFFSWAMGKEQYEPIDALPKAENRLFTQFHAQYPLQEKERWPYLGEILTQDCLCNSRIWCWSGLKRY